MHNLSSVGAIFTLFILCVHCDNAKAEDEIAKIYVPAAPQNLSAHRITADEIHFSWAPPLNDKKHGIRFIPIAPTPLKPTTATEKDVSLIINKVQNDAPRNDLIAHPEMLADAPKDFDYWYKSDKHDDIIIDEFRTKRDLRSHRHRKRRQDNVTDVKNMEKTDLVMHHAGEASIEVSKKSYDPLKDPTQIAYVLYYEQGVSRSDTTTIKPGVQSSADVKKKNVFPSDLGMEQYSRATKNLTLLNTSGVPTKVVGFRLRNLKAFTPYKIWVRAFYNFSLDGVKSSDLIDRLGPSSIPLYVLTDVLPPSAPIILNLTCDLPQGIIYLQWRQPLWYNNSLDKYVVTLRRVPEPQPRSLLTLPTSTNDIETTIMINEDLSNDTVYVVKIYAVTRSVARNFTIVNGTESPPEEVSGEKCSSFHAAMLPADARPGVVRGVTTHALLILVPLALLAAVVIAIVYWRCRSRLSKCISAAYNYLEEGGERGVRAPLNSYKKPAPPDGSPPASAPPRPPRMSGAAHPALQAAAFPAHCAANHQDGDIGFSKEYEIVVSKSAALGHTSHHSHRPENRTKNRYLNITAYDHSRVCVSGGARCGAAGCVGRSPPAPAPGAPAPGAPAPGAPAPACDYVNANFIDGMLPALSPKHLARIKRKLNRNKPNRQPSIKASKPPPNLAEGIESAFLNIEFSGIVESEDQSDSDSASDDDSHLDDVYVMIDGEKTRVKLEWLIWRRRYIATQGPTPATLDAFWRMIWQHRVYTVVMITNLVERGRRKCDMYWPDGGAGSSIQFGHLRVTLLHECVLATYTVRHLAVTNTQVVSQCEGSTRTVVQYHYTVWPDHGTPRHPLQVLPFVQAPSPDPRPLLVHCSAGVGRTGTYIVLDAQLNQLKLTGTLSPLGFLCRARTQRNYLVQTEEQYVFVHDALLEHVRSGNTDVEVGKGREYLATLLDPISEDELAVLDLNSTKNKSVIDLTNGIGNCETASVKSTRDSVKSTQDSAKSTQDSVKSTQDSVKSTQDSVKEVVENGSQMSIKTEDLNSDQSKSSVRDMAENKDGLVNGEVTEGVYDLAPRSTDTYSKKMQAYNSLSEQEKEEIRRVNRAENYALLERMRSLANRHHTYQGPPPVNLLEKQYLLITRSCVEPSVCARAAHNVDKNRLGGVLPSDSARVMLVPKPGVEGSEYINASWVCGRRRLREYCVAQHPAPQGNSGSPLGPSGSPLGPSGAQGRGADLWRLVWDHTAQLILLLSNTEDPECEIFWPTEEEKELYVANFKASYVSKEIYVAHRKCDRKSPSPVTTPSEPEINGFRRQESECADDERLIPENSPVPDESPYRLDRTELRLERLSNRDLSTRKSIANGDLFSSFSEKRNGPKSPKSPSKMSLKNFKLSSPTKFKFPEWGSKTAGSPPEMAPPPPPVVPSLTVEEEAELHRPCYYFEKVESIPDNVPSDRIIEVTNVSVHSLQDDYQLSVKFIKCSNWLEGNTTDYTAGKPDENEFVKAVREAMSESEKEEAIDRLIEPYKDSFGLIEYVAGCQMEYKNGPVVVVDKYGGWKAMTFCVLSAACGGIVNPDIEDPSAQYRPASSQHASLYRWWALGAGSRCGTHQQPQSLRALLAGYCALAAYPLHTLRPCSPEADSR